MTDNQLPLQSSVDHEIREKYVQRLGRVIASKRATLSISQMQLAKVSGVSRAAIALLESSGGTNDPKLSTLLALSNALNTSLPMLLLEADIGVRADAQDSRMQVVGDFPAESQGISPRFLGLGLGGPIGALIGLAFEMTRDESRGKK